jgi:glycosyltransferase involved in cell wall biosynthesis
MTSAGKVAVLIPAYNEAATIAAVVSGFCKALPDATVYVFDNNSNDATVAEAEAAGACVRTVAFQGKGNVVRRMFADVDADVYVMADGDGTYEPTQAPVMIAKLLAEGLDMVVGVREHQDSAAYRPGHVLGNRLLTQAVTMIFGRSIKDMLSGYRVFSRRYAKTFPAHSRGFEIETELTVFALRMRLPVVEMPTRYHARPEGSESKLNTWGDGMKISWKILSLFKSERPMLFFMLCAGLSALASVALAAPLVHTYVQTGLVPRFPTAILCAALMILAAIFMACGLILDSVTKGRDEAKRTTYMAIAAPGQNA